MSTPRSITDRMIGALRLDDATYEEVEADTTATGQAAFVVVGSSIAAAAGNALLRGGEVDSGILVAIAQLLGWAVNAWLAWFIGTKVIAGPQTRSTWGEVARTIGFANTPRFLLVFVAVPGFTGFVRVVVALWVLIATLIALRSRWRSSARSPSW
ncbi:MAG: hypothetical protein AUH85_14775 [Chloroflexi bacterium 13_1_40CM_4_68_4]|nr:MAG: hypothetical protein AUH85_14775 [Chloroflexi bacterium 13_1_40CM_4_68_4]